MAAIYIASKAGQLAKSGETLVFTQPDGTKTTLFPFKLEMLLIMGKVSLTGDAIRLLTRNKIPTVFLSSNGQFNARLVYGDSKNVFLRQKQYAILSNAKQSLSIARSIVEGKLHNEAAFMQRIKRKTRKDDALIAANVEKIKYCINKTANAASVEALRGFEGEAAKLYFDVFAFNITCPWAVFNGRSRNPPKSNVNAVMSFLYTLLMYRVEAAVESQGLDSMAGNLHACDYGRDSLVFDLMEEFRTPVCDTVCCALFNLGVLHKDDFRAVAFDEDGIAEEAEDNSGISPKKESADTGNMGILLTKAGLQKVIKAFEEKMTSEVQYDGERLPLQKIIIRQAHSYKRVIMGEEREYKGFSFK